MIKAIVFDWFGVCAERWIDLWVQELQPKIDVDSLKDPFVKYLDDFVSDRISAQQFLKSVFSELGRDPAPYEYLLTKHGKLNDELLDFILLLRQNFKTALISDNFQEMVEVIEEQIGGFSKYFDVVILSYELKLSKNDKAMFSSALNKLKAKPEECVFVDDRERNTANAKELGFNAILFKNNSQLKKELASFNVKVD